MSSIPIPSDLIKKAAEKTGIASPSKASIREIVHLVSVLEAETGISFIRLDMGVPGLPSPRIAIDAEIAALNRGVTSIYPDINGIPELKKEASRFIDLFIDIKIDPLGCIPTVGSLMGSMVSFLVANRSDSTKEGTLFIDPGFPVHKQQVKMLGHDFQSFDIYDHRGSKLKEKLESYFSTGKISSVLYSNPNNPAWICLKEEELAIIGELAKKYDVIVIEDLAYFGMDFRKDYSHPGALPHQPSVAHYCDDYILLISSSKIFSYAGQRIGIMAISDHLYNRSYPDLRRFFSSDSFGHSAVYGALYGLSAGVTHSSQIAMAALFKAANDGEYNFRDDVIEYGEKAKLIKKLFCSNGFEIVYDNDLGEPISDGFYFTVSYPGMTGSELLEKLLYYGISTVSLEISGSKKQGVRACVSLVPRKQFAELEKRLIRFSGDNKFKN